MNDNLLLLLIFSAGILFPFAICGIWCTVITILKMRKQDQKVKESTDEVG